jgi:alkylhydroperoxidase family enzyme
MSVIAPVSPAEITDPELRELVARCEALGVPDARFVGILARAPGYAKPMLHALLHAHTEGSVDHRLKEMIRIALARFAQDPYFASLRSKRALAAGLDEATIDAAANDYERDARFTPAERAALRFAETMYLNVDAVDAAFYAELKRHYSEAQIMEIGAFAALYHGFHVLMRTLGAGPQSTPLD